MTIHEAFSLLKNNLELKPTLDQIIQTRHKAVRGVIENSQLTIQDTKLIGSHQRQTRIHPTGETIDIDILVVLGQFDRWVPTGGITPNTALQNVHFVTSESERYQQMHPEVDSPTVTLSSVTNVHVEIVPAYIDNIGISPSGLPHAPVGRAYWIPNPDGSGTWKLADYDHDASQITVQNQTCDGMVIPTIKKLKAIKRIYFPELASYLLEALVLRTIPPAIQVRKIVGLPNSYPALIHDFFVDAQPMLDQHIFFPGSLTPATKLDPLTVFNLKQTFQTIADYTNTLIKLGDTPAAHQGWKKLFGHPYPQV
ncbi:MAG: SMODS domain-containing nucleotidyltransferase [Patescibacteria group bacterium]